MQVGKYYLEYSGVVSKDIYIVRCVETEVDLRSTSRNAIIVYNCISTENDSYKMVLSENAYTDLSFSLVPTGFVTFELTEEEVIKHVLMETI